MNCPKCESPRTMVDGTRHIQPDDGPQQTVRLRRCLRCRFRFRTVEEFMPGQFPWREGRRKAIDNGQWTMDNGDEEKI